MRIALMDMASQTLTEVERGISEVCMWLSDPSRAPALH